MVRLEHSGTEELLKGTKYLQPGKFEGKTIKSVIKGDWDSKRVIKFTDGSKVNANKKIVRASIDVKLDKVYKPGALKSIRVAPNGKAKVTIGGTIKGERVPYASKANARRGVEHYYSEDYGQYKQGIYPVRCPKHK